MADSVLFFGAYSAFLNFFSARHPTNAQKKTQTSQFILFVLRDLRPVFFFLWATSFLAPFLAAFFFCASYVDSFVDSDLRCPSRVSRPLSRTRVLFFNKCMLSLTNCGQCVDNLWSMSQQCVDNSLTCCYKLSTISIEHFYIVDWGGPLGTRSSGEHRGGTSGGAWEHIGEPLGALWGNLPGTSGGTYGETWGTLIIIGSHVNTM